VYPDRPISCILTCITCILIYIPVSWPVYILYPYLYILYSDPVSCIFTYLSSIQTGIYRILTCISCIVTCISCILTCISCILTCISCSLTCISCILTCRSWSCQVQGIWHSRAAGQVTGARSSQTLSFSLHSGQSTNNYSHVN
jgi:hypothetical protein